MGAEVHGQSFPVIVGREIPVLSEEKNFGVDENLSTTEKLMSKGAGRIKIIVVSSCNVGVQQSSVGPADTYSDVRSDLFTRIAQNKVEGRIQHEQVGATGPVVPSAGDVGEGQCPAVCVRIDFETHHSM